MHSRTRLQNCAYTLVAFRSNCTYPHTLPPILAAHLSLIKHTVELLLLYLNIIPADTMTTFRVTNSHQLAIIVASVVGVTLATICVALRFRARRMRKQPTEFDDWFCLAALVSLLLTPGSSLFGDLGANGTRHQILTWAFEAVNMAAVFVGGAGLPVATVNEIDPNAVAVYFKVSS